MHPAFSRLLAFALGLAVAGLSGLADAGQPAEKKLPAELSPAIDHLIAQIGPGRSPEFEPARVGPLIEFVLAGSGEGLHYEERDRQGTTSSSIAFEIESDLDRLMRYLYNPDIPGHVFSPSSVRFTRWVGRPGQESMPRLWEQAAGQHGAVIVRGTEHEEITPNLATGTYFAYDLARTLILFPWQGRPVLISLARQIDRSQVGRKGAVLGDDGNWHYLYSEEKGIGITGLGWADSYMYASIAINLFCETGEPAVVRGGSFKWLSAGWGGFNLVQRHHIYDGQVRYARDLEKLLENGDLPAPEAMAASFGRLQRLHNRELEEFFSRYLERLQRRHGGQDSGLSGTMAKLLGGAYLKQTSREEKVATLAVELMKGFLGRPDSDLRLLQAVGPPLAGSRSSAAWLRPEL